MCESVFSQRSRNAGHSHCTARLPATFAENILVLTTARGSDANRRPQDALWTSYLTKIKHMVVRLKEIFEISNARGKYIFSRFFSNAVSVENAFITTVVGRSWEGHGRKESVVPDPSLSDTWIA